MADAEPMGRLCVARVLDGGSYSARERLWGRKWSEGVEEAEEDPEPGVVGLDPPA